MCGSCGSFCPLDAIACPVCDIDLPERKIEPEVVMTNLGEKICPVCSHPNPNESSSCQQCDKSFPLPVMLGQAAPPKLHPERGRVECDGCGRFCCPEARICDWCGVALAAAAPVECVICNAALPPFVSYCGQCGIYFDPPPRLDPRNSALGSDQSKLPALDFDQLPQWSNCPLPDFRFESPPPAKSTPTPEVIKYKSRSIQAPPILKAKSRDNGMLPLLPGAKSKQSAVSPGNGYWRQQAEFVIQNHSERADLIAEYRNVF